MKAGEAIVEYFSHRDDIAALAVDKTGEAELIKVFLIKGICVLNIKCRYTESHILIDSLVPGFVGFEPETDRLDLRNYINSILNNGMASFGGQDSFECKQIFHYADICEIDGLLERAIKTAWSLYDERGKEVAFHMILQFILRANMQVLFTR